MKDINKILVNENMTIKEAMKIIDLGAIKTAIVVDDKNILLGVVTDGDIRRGIINSADVSQNICNVMNKDFVLAKINMNNDEILKLMKDKQITNLPLVNDNNVIKDFVILLDNENLLYCSEGKHIKKHLNRILVIGGGGYVGSILVRKLLAKNYSVNVLDSFIYGTEPLDEIKSNSNLKIIRGDTRHIEDISLAMRNVDAVVHLAELVGDPACALDPSKTQEINYMATRVIASLAKHFQINRLVYASSCSVYGASNDNSLLNEKSLLNPVSLYAKMKIASENALNEMQDTNFLPTILRFSTIFGFSPRPRFDLVVNILTAKAIKDGKITIFGGDQWRPNVHVADAANTILAVLEAPIEVVGGNIFNVGTEENNYTINQLGELVKEEIPAADLIIEDKEVDKRDYKVDFTKLKSILNIKMKYSVKDGIKEVKDALINDSTIDYTSKKYSNIKVLEANNLK